LILARLCAYSARHFVISTSKIPLFDRDRFVGTLSTIEALLVRGLVRVSYSKRGHLVRADCEHLGQVETGPADQRMFAAVSVLWARDTAIETIRS
jgi:hypothetical protein